MHTKHRKATTNYDGIPFLFDYQRDINDQRLHGMESAEQQGSLIKRRVLPVFNHQGLSIV